MDSLNDLCGGVADVVEHLHIHVAALEVLPSLLLQLLVGGAFGTCHGCIHQLLDLAGAFRVACVLRFLDFLLEGHFNLCQFLQSFHLNLRSFGHGLLGVGDVFLQAFFLCLVFRFVNLLLHFGHGFLCLVAVVDGKQVAFRLLELLAELLVVEGLYPEQQACEVLADAEFFKFLIHVVVGKGFVHVPLEVVNHLLEVSL